MKKRFSPHLVSCLASSILFTACSGSGGGGSGELTGAFVDSVVTGLAYEAGPRTGVTDATGQFKYSPGEVVRFSIGDIVLGEALGARVLTPVDLVPGAKDQTHPTVTNIARFLQTLDDDLDPVNGITIAPGVAGVAVGLSVDFSQTITAFENDPNVVAVLATLGAGPLTPTAAAQQHLESSLLSVLGGLYTGGFSGDDSGTYQVYLDRSGNFLGCGLSAASQSSFFLAGAIASDGKGSFGNVSLGASFDVCLDDGALTGTWVNPALGTAGVLSGQVNLPVEPGLDPSVMQQIAGDYSGFYKVDGVVNPLSLSVGLDGSIAVTAGPLAVVAAIQATHASGATARGMTAEGALIEADVSLDGSLQGTFQNPHFAESGEIFASKQ